MYKELDIDESVIELFERIENSDEIKNIFHEIDKLEQENTLKVLSAFHKNEVTESSFMSTTGY